MRTFVLPGVLRPPSDCWLLIEAMRERNLARGRRVLDVFTGSGVMAVAAALDGADEVTAVDVSHRAVFNARLNARINGVRAEVLRGDLFGPVTGRRFDLIVANPPYVPSASDDLPAHGPARAWDGGTDGRVLVDRFCAEVAGHLAPAGSALMVHSSLNGEAATIAAFDRGGLEAKVVARLRGALGPVAADRVEMLEARGIIAPGAREEELLVFEAGTPLSESARGACH